jgi:hypothetical protein
MVWDREEFISYLTFGNAPRDMLCELMGLLVGLDKEWIAQGAAPGELDLTDFRFDYVPSLAVGNTGAIHLQKPQIIEETADHCISRDSWGRMVKLVYSSATIPTPMSYPVKTMDDWLRMKPMFEYAEERIDQAGLEKARALQAKGTLIRAGIPGGFDLPRELMGEEFLCLCYSLLSGLIIAIPQKEADLKVFLVAERYQCIAQRLSF